MSQTVEQRVTSIEYYLTLNDSWKIDAREDVDELFGRMGTVENLTSNNEWRISNIEEGLGILPGAFEDLIDQKTAPIWQNAGEISQQLDEAKSNVLVVQAQVAEALDGYNDTRTYVDADILAAQNLMTSTMLQDLAAYKVVLDQDILGLQAAVNTVEDTIIDETAARALALQQLESQYFTPTGQVKSTALTSYYTRSEADLAIAAASLDLESVQTTIEDNVSANLSATFAQDYYTIAGTDQAINDGVQAAITISRTALESVAGAANLVVNGSFLTGDMDFWYDFPALGDSFYIVERGSHSDSAVENAPTQFVMAMPTSGNHREKQATKAISVKPGERIRFSISVAAGGATSPLVTVQVRLRWLGPGGTWIDQDERNIITSSFSWADYDDFPSFPAPVGAALVTVNVRRVSGGAGIAYVTNVRAYREDPEITELKANIVDIQQTKVDEAGAEAIASQRVTAELETGGAIRTALDLPFDGLTRSLADIDSSEQAKVTEEEALAAADVRISAELDSNGLIGGALAANRRVVEAVIRSGNYIPNGNFHNGNLELWEPTPGFSDTYDVVAKGAASDSAVQNAPTPYVLRMQSGSTDQQRRAVSNIGVKPGDAFRVEMMAAAGGVSPSTTIQIRLIWRNADGGHITSFERNALVSSFTWQSFNDFPVAIAPSNAALLDIDIRRVAGGSGRAYLTNLRAHRDDPASLNIDGRITSLEAVSVTADGVITIVTEELEASFGSIGAMASAAASAEATAEIVRSRQFLGVVAGDEGASMEMLAYDGTPGSGSEILFNANKTMFKGSVGMELLTLSSMSGNLIPDGSFSKGVFGEAEITSGSAAIMEANSNSSQNALSTAKSRYMLYIDSNGGQVSMRRDIVFDPEPDGSPPSFYWAAEVATSGSTQNVTWEVRIAWRNSDGDLLFVETRQINRTSLGWVSWNEEFTAPSSAASISAISVRRLGGGSGGGYITKMLFRQQSSAVTTMRPGSITTPLLGANVVEASKIKLDGVTISGDGSGALVLSNEGVSTGKMAPGAASSDVGLQLYPFPAGNEADNAAWFTIWAWHEPWRVMSFTPVLDFHGGRIVSISISFNSDAPDGNVWGFGRMECRIRANASSSWSAWFTVGEDWDTGLMDESVMVSNARLGQHAQTLIDFRDQGSEQRQYRALFRRSSTAHGARRIRFCRVAMEARHMKR